MGLRDYRGGLWRSRWAAIGAAVAITFGAGGLVAVNAADGQPTAFVAIAPCRLVDTRPAPTTIGSRSTPLASGEIATFAVHGTNGNCTIPAGASAIVANVTVTNPTDNSYLTVWPSDAAQPNASNLNWTTGQSPTPNAVTVGLSSDGHLNVFNERGTVNVIIDISGYYMIDISGYYEDHGLAIVDHYLRTSFTPRLYTVAIPGVEATAEAFCEPGDIATGGGLSRGQIGKLHITGMGPRQSETSEGWSVTVVNDDVMNIFTFGVTVQCLDVAPLRDPLYQVG